MKNTISSKGNQLTKIANNAPFRLEEEKVRKGIILMNQEIKWIKEERSELEKVRHNINSWLV